MVRGTIYFLLYKVLLHILVLFLNTMLRNYIDPQKIIIRVVLNWLKDI